MFVSTVFVFVTLNFDQFKLAEGFQSRFHKDFPCNRPIYLQNWIRQTKNDYDEGEVGKGPNWIEKSFPVETGGDFSAKKVEEFDLGISGESFQTGPLSKRMFDAITSRTSLELNDDILEAFILYAMDFTAKEATRAALKQNGLEMVLMEEEEDQGMWGDVEAVRLYNSKTGNAISNLYDSLEEAAKNWKPGQPFDFVVRQVPAKIRELSLDELLQALDPEGKIQNEAEGVRGMDNFSGQEALDAIFDYDYSITSLKELATSNEERTNSAPTKATTEDTAFTGLDKRGYRAIKRRDLLRALSDDNQTEDKKSESSSPFNDIKLDLKTNFNLFLSDDARNGCSSVPWGTSG